ncbi:MAG TPA: methyltransferase domain-containing protein, partial [Nitrosomonas sp.]|nr:methyltransferase domain-containing protein [Nitrosomonas sp.]
MWASYIDPSQITGIDFSSVAIEKALQHYPAIRFISENWLDLLTEQKESFDVVFSSNTLEHFHQPYNVLNTISSHATKSIVLILPYKEHDRITEHFSSFLPENIPLVLKNRFRLAWSKIIDCRMIPNTFWLGEQIVLIYATINWLDTIGIVLKDCLIEQIDSEARLNYLKSEHSKQISLINQSLAEHDALISSLNQSLVERDALISSLNQSLVERGNQITDLTQILLNKNQEISSTKTELEAAISQYTKIMESNSMRFTSFARHLRRTLSLGLHLLVIFIQTAKALGLRNAISKTQTFLMQKIARPKSISELTLSNQDRYLMEQSAQKNYLKNYLAGEIEVNHLNFIHENFPQNIFKSKKILIYPLSYPMELTQRPDHILRYFAENGYSCFILTIDNSPFFIKEILPNIYLTNLFASVISYFSNKSLVFYITYPFFSYVEKHLRKSITIYDILDDLSVFSLNCEAMRLDHKYLLDKADISLFSSQELLDTNKQFAKGQTFLVNNGVWINDFKIDQEQTNSRINFKKHPDEFVIGYHGAISELLDWELIEQLIKIPKLRFVFIGPITQFDHKIGEISQTLQQKVLISDQVTHIPPVAYSVLKNYLVGFDAGIIPFVINEKTNPVAPLKLFEYMAMGLIIFATPTKTLWGARVTMRGHKRDQRPFHRVQRLVGYVSHHHVPSSIVSILQRWTVKLIAATHGFASHAS